MEGNMNWIRTSHIVHSNGESEIVYEAEGTELKIESRKRAIPHANRSGSWMHTSYFLIRPDGTETEHYSLTRAKEAAEHER